MTWMQTSLMHQLVGHNRSPILLEHCSLCARNGSIHFRMEGLPDDLVLTVFGFLSVCDLCRAAQTCQRLRLLGDSEALWVELLHRRLTPVRPSLQSSKALYAAIETGVNSLINQFLKDTSEMQSALALERAQQLANLDRRLKAKRHKKRET